MAHVPHVPPTQAIPPPHWLLAVHAVQTPAMHTSPGSGCGPNVDWLQSPNVEHAPHVLLTHPCPVGHPSGGLQPGGLVTVQMPAAQVSGDAQSPFTVHVHCMPVWVDAHVAVGPH